MHVRCPHCQNPIEVIADDDLSDVSCPSCGSSFNLLTDPETLSHDPSAAKTIAHFELVEQVGLGAFGAVWKAKDTQLDRTVAIKIPRKDQLDEAETEQFLREARSAAQLKHSGIVSVHEVGREDGQVYIVSDFVEGVPLSSMLTARRPMIREAAEISAAVAESLQHAHDNGVIHRDLKPSNIMLDDQGVPHLMDFGLAKREAGEVTMTMEGKVLGTPAYMSPEQARGEGHHVDGRSDIYSLGAVLFELLTGERPFRGDMRMLLHQVINDEAPSPRKLNAQVPKDLETICLKCLSKEPQKRYDSAQTLADDLERFLKGEPIKARPISRMARTWRWCKRNPVVAGLTAVVMILLLILGIGGSIVAWRQADEIVTLKSISLAAQSQANSHDLPELSLIMAIEAVENTRQHDGSILPHARQSLYDSVRQIGGTPLRGPPKDVTSAAFSPDSRWLATCSLYEVANLWQLNSVGSVASRRILKGHDAPLSCVSISPDGHWVITGSWDKTARLWDLRADNPALSPIILRGHDSAIWSLAVSSDSRWLVTGSYDNTARLWDLQSENPAESFAVLQGHEEPVVSVAISPDNRWLITGSLDHSARLWDLEAENPAESSTVLNGHDAAIWTVAVSPDGHWLVTGSRDNTARLWNLESKTPSTTAILLRGHEGPVVSMAISPDSRRLITGSYDKTARLWDLQSDDPADSAFVLRGHEHTVWSVAVSPDNRWLISGSQDKTARLWDLQSENPAASVRVMRGHDGPVSFVAFSPSSSLVVTCRGDQKAQTQVMGSDTYIEKKFPPRIPIYARLWDIRTGDPFTLSPVLRGHESIVSSVAIGPHSRWLVTGSFDKTARLWDLQSENPSSSTAVLRGHVEPVVSVGISPDARWLVTGSLDHTARLWDLNSGSPAESSIVLPGHEGPVVCTAISPDSRWLVTGSYDKTARLWDLQSDNPAGSAIVLRGHEKPVLSLGISSDSRWLVTVTADQTSWRWSLISNDPARTGKRSQSRGLSSSITSIGMLGRPESFVDIRYNTFNANALSGQLEFDRSAISTMALDGSKFRARSWDNRWSVSELSWYTLGLSDGLKNNRSRGGAHRQFYLYGHEGPVVSAAFSRDNHWLVTGSYDHTARLWDLQSDDPPDSAVVLRGHEGPVSSVAISPDGRWLVTGSHDKTTRLWDLKIDSLIERAKRVAGNDLKFLDLNQYKKND